MHGFTRFILTVPTCVLLAWATPARPQTYLAEWVIPSAYRLDVTVDPGTVERRNSPVGVAIDFQELFAREKIPGRLDRHSIRVVRYDPSSGQAVPVAGAYDVYATPHQLTGDFPNDDAGMVWWRMADESSTRFHVYFDTTANGHKPRPAVIGLVGVGDTFHYNDGRPGFANAVALHSQFWHLDWDGDGLRDFIGFGYRQYEYGRELDKDLGNAVYFYKNIGTPRSPLFAPRYRLRASDGSYLHTDLLPQNMVPDDWDGDGDIDFIEAGRRNELLLWENTGQRDRNNLWVLEPPQTLGVLDGVSDFRERAEGVVEGAWFAIRGLRRVDWEGDGDLDLLVSYRTVNKIGRVDPQRGVIPYGAGLLLFELWENTGQDEPGRLPFARPRVIMEERGLPIHAHSVATGCAEYVDWDGDGDGDLLFHDDTNRPLEGGRLMFAENCGTRAEPLFLMPIPILPVSDSPFVVDWNEDGRFDLVTGSEFFENVNPRSGRRTGDAVPGRTAAGTIKPHAWSYPRLVSRGYAQQVQPEIISYFAVSVDWDADGDLDLVRGHRSHVMLFRNRGTTLHPVFDRGVQLEAGGRPIFMPNSLDPQGDEPAHWGPQGPSEAIYGWLNPAIGDWDGDGDLDLFVTGQRWQTQYFENVGTRAEPRFACGREVRCDKDPHEFSWRSKVSIGDLDGDQAAELVVTSDQDNTFYLYERKEEPSDPAALDLDRGRPLRLEGGEAVQGWYGGQNNNGDNHSVLADWDGDGDLDLINGSLWAVWYYENVGTPTDPKFKAHGRMTAGGDVIHTFNHAGSVDTADWNEDGRLDLVTSTECPSDQPHGAVLHLFDRTFIENQLPTARLGPVESRGSPFSGGASARESKDR